MDWSQISSVDLQLKWVFFWRCFCREKVNVFSKWGILLERLSNSQVKQWTCWHVDTLTFTALALFQHGPIKLSPCPLSTRFLCCERLGPLQTGIFVFVTELWMHLYTLMFHLFLSKSRRCDLSNSGVSVSSDCQSAVSRRDEENSFIQEGNGCCLSQEGNCSGLIYLATCQDRTI